MIKYITISPNSDEEIELLCNVKTKIYKEFLHKVLPEKIIDYILFFVNFNSIKDEIEIDKIFYCLIKKEEEIIGFFKYQKQDNIIHLPEFYLLEEERNKKILKNTIEYLKSFKKEKIKKITTQINKNNKIANLIFKHLGFKFIEMQTKCIGNDIYLTDNLYELNF